MGITGSGKGTLIHYLIKNVKLYAEISQNGEISIKLKNITMKSGQFPNILA
jgi:ABC-type phosphate transport system ATPase subunit